jgi:hypothetical protein
LATAVGLCLVNNCDYECNDTGGSGDLPGYGDSTGSGGSTSGNVSTMAATSQSVTAIAKDFLPILTARNVSSDVVSSRYSTLVIATCKAQLVVLPRAVRRAQSGVMPRVDQ